MTYFLGQEQEFSDSLITKNDLINLDNWIEHLYGSTENILLDYSHSKWYITLNSSQISRRALTVGFKNLVNEKKFIERNKLMLFPITVKRFRDLCKKGTVNHSICTPFNAFKEYLVNNDTKRNEWSNKNVPKAGKYLLKKSISTLRVEKKFHIFKKIYFSLEKKGL